MTILHIADAADKSQLRPRRSDDFEELMDALHERLADLDGWHELFLKEAMRQAMFVIDVDKAGVWVVKDETEERWLSTGLSALSQALQAGWPQEAAPHEPAVWMRYFGATKPVIVEYGTGHVDLLEHSDMITGKCKWCGAWTTGISYDFYDELTAADIEGFDDQAAKGEWWCEECYRNRCDDCGEQPQAPEDDECCAACRQDRDADEVAT